MLLVAQFLACAVVKVGPMCNQCEKLRIENERLKSLGENLPGYLHKLVRDENDTLKAKLAEAEAENERLRNNETGCQADYANLERELTREREAAKVMREALAKIGTAMPPNALSMVARKAIFKADEIRGGE